MYKLTTLSILTVLFFCSSCGLGRRLFKQGSFAFSSTQKQTQFDLVSPLFIRGLRPNFTPNSGLELSLGNTIAMIDVESFYLATRDSHHKVIEVFKTQTDLRLFIRNKNEVLEYKEDMFSL
jgi:hypothetical protein